MSAAAEITIDPVAKVVTLALRRELELAPVVYTLPFAMWKAVTIGVLEAELVGGGEVQQRPPVALVAPNGKPA
jgi:hypothetical protein